MQRPILAANWKMHHGPSDARHFVAAFVASYAPRPDRTVVLFPSALAFHATRDALGARTDIVLGVQNIHWEGKGAFTGENSATMARDAGAALVLVGHSERRHVFGETDEDTARKTAAALRESLSPMLCVGEKLEERKAGRTTDVVRRQLRAGLSSVAGDAWSRVLVAYEPVWAIGTGVTATPADASEVHLVIREELAALSGASDVAARIPILYGGSVKTDNARALLDATGVDGLLVGGASLDPATWSAIAST